MSRRAVASAAPSVQAAAARTKRPGESGSAARHGLRRTRAYAPGSRAVGSARTLPTGCAPGTARTTRAGRAAPSAVSYPPRSSGVDRNGAPLTGITSPAGTGR